jgi:cysteine-rich repeat protein
MRIYMRHYRGLSGLVLLGAVGAFAAAGCGDTFTSCYETHTCPRGGSGGSEGGAEVSSSGEGAVAGSEVVGGSDTETSGGEAQGGSSPMAGSAGEGGEPSLVPKEGCGDGVVQVEEEECDDQNAIAGDGCSEACIVEPVQIVGMQNVVCALGSNGQIRCFGVGSGGWEYYNVGLALGEEATGLAAEYGHLCAIVNGGARCWGDNTYGQLGRGDKTSTTLADLSSNIDLGTGAVVTGVAVGYAHSCAVLKDGKTKCWGSNESGQLGIPTNMNNKFIGDEPEEMGNNLQVIAPTFSASSDMVAAGRFYSCARRIDKSVRCWGGGAGGSYTPAGNLDLGTPSTVAQLAVAGSHACALLTNNDLKCWGSNGSGQLGQDDAIQRANASTMGDALLPINVGAGRVATSVFAVGESTCAVLNDGSAKCWGRNSPQGRLGTGDIDDRGAKPGDMANLKPLSIGTGRKAKQVAMATAMSCALLDNGTIACWGAVFAPELTVLGDEPNEMGDKLPIITLRF